MHPCSRTGVKLPGAARPSPSVLDREPSAGRRRHRPGVLCLRQRCYCTMFEAARTILPAGLWFRRTGTLRLGGGTGRGGAPIQKVGKTPLGPELIRALAARGGSADLAELQREPGGGSGRCCGGPAEKVHRSRWRPEPSAASRTRPTAWRSWTAPPRRRRPKRSAGSGSPRRRAAALRFLLTAGRTGSLQRSSATSTGASLRTVEAAGEAWHSSA